MTDQTRDIVEPGAPAAAGDAGDENPYVPIDQPDATASTPMEQLISELTAGIETPYITLAVPGRSKYAVRYRGDLDGATIDHARNASKRSSKRTMVRGGGQTDDIDGVVFTSRICVAACVGILRDGVLLVDEKQRPFVFNHTGLMRMLGADTTIECVKLFYARDASIAAAADRIMGESGWNTEAQDLEDITPVDPPVAG